MGAPSFHQQNKTVFIGGRFELRRELNQFSQSGDSSRNGEARVGFPGEIRKLDSIKGEKLQLRSSPNPTGGWRRHAPESAATDLR